LWTEYGERWVWLSFDPEHKFIAAFVTGRLDQAQADELLAKTKAVNDGSLHVFFSDGRKQYAEAILKSFGRWRIFARRKGQRGRPRKPRLEPVPGLLYAQVVKQRRKGRVVSVSQKIVFGTEQELQAYLARSAVSRHINTAFVERQNGTMRQHNRRFTRKTNGFSRESDWMDYQLHLCIGYYHFCLAHSGLREEISPPLPTKGDGSAKRWREITPAMSVGVTDHVWSVEELLTYRLPPEITSKSIVKGH